MTEKIELNYEMGVEKFLKEINPNLVTNSVSTHGIVYFNSDNFNDNAYLEKLLNLYQQASATHSNLINLKRNLLIGEGLVPETQGDLATQQFIDHVNLHGMNLNDVWKKVCYDYALYEAYSVQTIYNSLGQITDVYYNDVKNARAVGNDSMTDSNVTQWNLSKEWARITNKAYRNYTPATKGTPIDNFNPRNFASSGGKQLLYCTNGSTEIYSIPSYNSVIGYVELDYELQRYHLNKLKNGFFANVIVSLKGSPSEEEKKTFTDKFKRRFLSAEGDKILFLWTEGNDSKPEIVQFDNSNDSQVFDILNKITLEKICSGHGVPPELASIQSTGGVNLSGDQNKMAVAYSYMIQSVIRPMQNQMLSQFNKIMKVNGLGNLSVNTLPLNIDQTNTNTVTTN